MTPELRFKDKVALVAGGTGALGRAVATAFAREGARIIVTYRHQQEFDAFISQSKSSGYEATGVMVDATDPAGVARMVEDILAKRGALDILVNTIGAYHGGKRIWEEEPSSLRADDVPQSESWICARPRRDPGDDPAEPRLDRQRGLAGGLRHSLPERLYMPHQRPGRWRYSIRSPRKLNRIPSPSILSYPASSTLPQIDRPCPQRITRTGPSRKRLPT